MRPPPLLAHVCNASQKPDIASSRTPGSGWLQCGTEPRRFWRTRMTPIAALLPLTFQGWTTAISIHFIFSETRRVLSGRSPQTAAQIERETPFEFADFRGLPLLLLSSTEGGATLEQTVSRGGSPRPATNASRSETRTILRRPIRKVATGNLPAESQFFAVWLAIPIVRAPSR